MCGAFTLQHSKLDVVSRFMIPDLPDSPVDAPRFKVSPSEAVEVVRMDRAGKRVLEAAKWGLVPFWAKDPAIGRKLINARAEGIEKKPAFRAPLAKRRCLIPADGFYEWDHESKQPMYFRRTDGGLFAFAGLWEDWRSGGDDVGLLRTCTLITTEANQTVGRVHDRMPVMLMPSDEAGWLDSHPSDAPLASLTSFLRPFPDDLMEGYWVSKQVNTRGEHGPESIIPV